MIVQAKATISIILKAEALVAGGIFVQQRE